MLTDGHIELAAKNVRLDGDCFVFTVEFSGCGNEVVDLHFNGIMPHSLPPQITLTPVILEPGLCEMWNEKEVRIDYTSLLTINEEVMVKFPGMEGMISIRRK